MRIHYWVRQAHRWISVLFVLIVAAEFVATARGEVVEWVYYIPLLPLALLAMSGIYLFVRPYATGWRSKKDAARMT